MCQQSFLNQKTMIKFTEILACEGTAIYYTESQSLHFHCSGRLQILMAFDGLVMLKLDDFEYGVNPNSQIQYSTADPQFQMVIYLRRYPKGDWVLKINDHSDELFSCLNEKSYLKQKDKANKYGSFSSQAQQSKQVIKSSVTKANKKREFYDDEDQVSSKQQTEKQQKQGSKITAGSLLVGASTGVGWGLAWTGKMIGKGAHSIGSYFSKNVQPKEQEFQVSQATKSNLKLAKKTTKNVLEFTAKQVGNLFTFGKQVASDIGERFEESDKGKELQQSPKYQMVKSGASTGAKVLANIYDGAVNAMYEIGGGVSKGASKVVGAKYGEDAGQVMDEVMQGTGNIVKITRVPLDQTYKTFKQ